jgi:hypothetical protein
LIALNAIALTAGGVTDIDLTDLNNRSRISNVSSIYLNTTLCRGQIGVTNAQTQQRVVAPPGTAGWFAFPLRDPLRFSIVATRAGTLSLAVSSALIIQAPVKTTSDEDSSYTVEGVINSTTSSVLLASENFLRAGVSIYNNSSNNLFVRCSESAATTSVFTARITSQGYWQTPYGYQGAIQGVWDGASGNALVTEFN